MEYIQTYELFRKKKDTPEVKKDLIPKTTEDNYAYDLFDKMIEYLNDTEDYKNTFIGSNHLSFKGIIDGDITLVMSFPEREILIVNGKSTKVRQDILWFLFEQVKKTIGDDENSNEANKLCIGDELADGRIVDQDIDSGQMVFTKEKKEKKVKEVSEKDKEAIRKQEENRLKI